MTREETVTAIKSSFVSVSKGVVMTYLAQMPWTQLPIIKQVIEGAVTKVLEIIANAVETQAFFLYIDFRTNEQGRTFTDRALAYEAAKLTGDKDAIKKAEAELIVSLRALVKYTN